MRNESGRRIYRRHRGQRTELGEQEKRRLLQLGVCLLLFLVVFFARGMDRLAGLREGLSGSLGMDGDFQGVLAVLRGDVSVHDDTLGETLARVWSGLFLPRERTVPSARENEIYYQQAKAYLNSGEGALALLGRSAGTSQLQDPMSGSGAAPEPEVVVMAYTGPTLPDNTTMDRYNLHLSQTVTPVLSHVTSIFGWRDDPIERGERFHYGLDLAAAEGTDVLAFAAGTVEYIGEGESYGQYLQLDHGGGVKSFYAHCSKLCVRQGQQVAAGEKVAESGATGHVTGPHLHFELKKDNILLNPAYYINFES